MFPVFVVLFGFVALVFVIVGYTTNPSAASKNTPKKFTKENNSEGLSGS